MNAPRAEADSRTGAVAGGQLAQNFIVFARLLRRLGVPVATSQQYDLLRAMGLVNLAERAEVKAAARCILVSRREDLAMFDTAFDWFWRRQADAARRGGAGAASASDNRRSPSLRAVPMGDERGDESASIERGKHVTVQTWSDREQLRRKDFAEFTPEELEQARRELQALAWHPGLRATRRHERGGHEFLNVRTMMRRNLRYGGELLDLSWHRTKFRPRPLVVLCDISGSMEPYSRMLLHFVHALSEREGGAECFVFGTRLTRITRQLRMRSVERALSGVAGAVVDWSGGTRIGAALKTFNYVWARRVLRPGAVLLLISDGWDRGDPALLAREMARLRKTVFRIIWLNPLIASADYEPLTAGLHAALPYVDDFLPAHNLKSLGDLARRLGELNMPGAREKTYA